MGFAFGLGRVGHYAAAFLGFRHGHQEIMIKYCPLIGVQHRGRFYQLAGNSVACFALTDIASIFTPGRGHTPYIIQFHHARLTGASPERPAFPVQLCSNVLVAVQIIFVDVQNVASTVIVTTPDRFGMRRLVHVVARYKPAIGQEPRSLRRGHQETILVPDRPKGRHSNTLPLALAMGHAIFSPAGCIQRIQIIEEGLKIGGHATIGGADVDRPVNCRQVQFHPIVRQFLKQLNCTPGITHRPRLFVHDHGHDISILQPGLEFEPGWTVGLFRPRFVTGRVLIPFGCPAIPVAGFLNIGFLPFRTGQIRRVAGYGETDITERCVTGDRRDVVIHDKVLFHDAIRHLGYRS